jgi:anti-sigma regulatory factor (Ser/Thr protein kinase)
VKTTDKNLTVPADIDYLADIRNHIKKIALKNNYTSKIIHIVQLAVDEVCTNIIRHGYKDIIKGLIQIEVIPSKTQIEVVVIDQGTTHHPNQIKDPDLKKYVEVGKIGGLGIMMIRKLMDEIKYIVTPRGNEFHLIKYRSDVKRSRFQSLKRIFQRTH